MATARAGETWQEKFVRRFKEEPLVPLGTALTVFTLVMASTKVGKKGQAKQMNNWLRARVVAQGATIAAIVGGSYVYGNTKQQQDARAAANAASAEELRLKEKEEFEARLKIAEETHAFEEAMKTQGSSKTGGDVWSKLGWSQKAPADTEVVQAPKPVASTTTTAAPPAKSSGSSSWFGWGSSSKTSGSDAEKNPE